MATPKVHNRECRSTRATLTTSPIERVIDCLYFWRIIFAAADVVDGDTKEQMRAQERNTHGEEESTIFSWKAKHWKIFKNPIWSLYNGKQNDMATRADLSYVWKIDVSKPRSRRLRMKSCARNRSEIAIQAMSYAEYLVCCDGAANMWGHHFRRYHLEWFMV